MYESNMELSGSEETPEVTPEVTPEEEAPTPEVSEETPADPTPETTPEAEPEVNLYETPDGRKITAEQLQTEWKDNFLPEFTRKSQALAEIQRDKELNSSPEEKAKWKQEGYVPENYAEVIEIAKAEAIADIRAAEEQERNRVESIQKVVSDELTALKAVDPKLDENALFQHANKYGFQSLKTAHANMTDMKKTALNVEQRTLKNVQKREVDPISTGPGGEIPEASGYDPKQMGQFDSAGEYLASLKGDK